MFLLYWICCLSVSFVSVLLLVRAFPSLVLRLREEGQPGTGPGSSRAMLTLLAALSCCLPRFWFVRVDIVGRRKP